MHWRYVPYLYSSAQFCWAHSEFKRPDDDTKPKISGVKPIEGFRHRRAKLSGVLFLRSAVVPDEPSEA
jgi:hypothetical protein